MDIYLHEDNAGAVYLDEGEGVWALGPVTPDMAGRFATDAGAWANGDWQPNEADGQERADRDGLTLIATWNPAGIHLVLDDNGRPVAGTGGSDYIGHVLVDPDQLAAFVRDLDPIQRARHCEQLIHQARQIQGWLGSVRAQAVAELAQTTTQAVLAVELGVTPGRISQMVREGQTVRPAVSVDVALGTDTTEYLTVAAVVDGLVARGVDPGALTVEPDGTHRIELADGGCIALGTDDDAKDPAAWWDYTAYGADGDPWRTDGGRLDDVLDAIAGLAR